MADKDPFEVVVKEAARDDAGRGIARLSIEVMRALSLVSGDVIEIAGKKKATATAWYESMLYFLFSASTRVRN